MAEIKKFLDSAGTTHLWERIKEQLETKADKTDLTTLSNKIGTVTDGKTVVDMIADAQTAATYDDTALAARVTTAEGKITTLIGSDTDKSVRTIANEELAAQLIPETAQESLDTLSEIAAWIQAHPDDAATMNAAIEALAAKVGSAAEGETAATGLYAADAALEAKIQANTDSISKLTGGVESLGALAAKDSITNAEVADDAAIAMSKIDGLTAALAKKQDTIVAGTYDAYGAASDVLGTAADTSDAATVYGAKAYAKSLVDNLDTVTALTDTEIDAAITAATSTT